MIKIIEGLYNKKVDATGLAIFRICIGFVLLWEVYELFRYRHLIFDEIPYISFSIIDYKYALLIWLVVISCIILGLFTRTTTIINYVFSLVFFATIRSYGDHMLNVFMTINFFLIFTSISKVLSFDAIFNKLRVKNSSKISNKVSVLNYYSLVFMVLGLVYFTSIFSKVATDYWMNGLILWKFMSIPTEFARYDFSFLLNHKIIMQVLAYTTLIFEASFIFICFKKWGRRVVLCFGVLFHIGILVALPINTFPFGFLSLYILLVPFSFWRLLKIRLKRPASHTLYIVKTYRNANLLSRLIKSIDVFKSFSVIITESYCEKKKFDSLGLNFWIQSKSRVISDPFKVARYISFKLPFYILLGIIFYIPFLGKEFFKLLKLLIKCLVGDSENEYREDSIILRHVKVRAITLFFICLLILQGHQMLDAKLFKKLGMPQNIVRVKKLAKSAIGLSEHSLFTYDYEKNNIHLYSIGITYLNKQRELWLPLTKKNGKLGALKIGSIKAKSFYASKTTKLDSVRINEYVRSFTAFWSFKNKVNLDNATFKVYIKRFEIPVEWEKDMYRKNLNKPWVPLGRIIWKDTTYNSELNHLKLIK